MYKATYESDRGEVFTFGVDGNNVFDMDVGNGVSVSLETSQGFAQIGQTVKTSSVSSRQISVNGCIFRDIVSSKNRMRRIFAPFSSGTLRFNGKYSTRVYVKNAPSFSPVKGNGKFSLSFLAPFPFFYANEETVLNIGVVKPMFKFPVNYSTPHKFGESPENKSINAENQGETSVPFELSIHFKGNSVNPTITNLETFSFLKINGEFVLGDVLRVYRSTDGIFRAEKTSGGITEDVISLVDEDSTLFELSVGDNLLQINDDNGGEALSATIIFRAAVTSLYED